MASDLKALLERVEAATGPDREIDRLVHFSIVHPWLADRCVKWLPAAFEDVGNFLWWDAARLAEPHKEGYPDYWEPVTSSADAALALFEQEFPGWIFTIARHYGHDNPTGPFYADVASVEWVQDAPGSAGQQAEAYGATPALAILSALLKVLIARDAA